MVLENKIQEDPPMIKRNCRWITIAITILLVISAFIWSPHLFDLYIRLYTHPENLSPKAALLKRYLEQLDKCPIEEPIEEPQQQPLEE